MRRYAEGTPCTYRCPQCGGPMHLHYGLIGRLLSFPSARCDHPQCGATQPLTYNRPFLPPVHVAATQPPPGAR